MDSRHPRNRRGIGFVTPNACTECRKKRAKCDGHTPCARCASQEGVRCVYEVPTRQSKDEMRREITQLRNRQRKIERILAALSSQDQSDQILTQLQNGDSVEAIGSRLRNLSSSSAPHTANVTTYSANADFQAIHQALEPAQNTRSSAAKSSFNPYANAFQISPPNYREEESPQWSPLSGRNENPETSNQSSDAMNWHSDETHSAQPSSILGTWQEHPLDSGFDTSLQSARSRGQDLVLGDRTGSDSSPDSLNLPAAHTSWTMITSDVQIVEHLLALYFCWEYPTFASLSKEHFMEDFRRGVPRYCSSLLVNALLSLGCRFSDQPIARADPNDTKSTGDHFFAEATRLLESEEDHRVLTTIQAIGIMSIREASCGRVKESNFLSGQAVRLAIEMGLHIEAEAGEEDSSVPTEAEEVDDAVRQATFWGAFSLDEAWSLCTGSLPHFSRLSNLAVKPAILRHVEIASWIPYTDDGGPLEQNCIQPSNIRSVYKTFCELSEVIHRSLYTFYTPGQAVTSKALLEAYSQYINWYDTVPDTLRLGHNFTPAVLFSHLYYHFAILLLFRPFVKYTIVNSDVSPKDTCEQASLAISAIMKSYSSLYSLRRTPSFVTYFVLASTSFHLSEVQRNKSNASSKERLARNMRDLESMSSSHGFSRDALGILRVLAGVWGVEGFGEEDPKRVRLLAMDKLVPIIGEDLIKVPKGDENWSLATWVAMTGLPLVDVDEQEGNGFKKIASGDGD